MAERFVSTLVMNTDQAHDAYNVGLMGPVDRDIVDLVLDRALCANLPPERFFPFDPGAWGGRIPRETDPRWETARKVCQACPVRLPCLAYAISFSTAAYGGMWGGRTPRERKAIAKAIRTSATLIG